MNYADYPETLSAPVEYLLNLGGKRIRPILCLMAGDLFQASAKDCMPAALAIEIFHNSTLAHDDIMDDAAIRRGKATIHEKYGQDAGILSGDVMIFHSIELLLKCKKLKIPNLLSIFNKTAKEVCFGQQMDMDFESRNDISLEEYTRMIALKTSVLIGCSLQLGAIIADASNEDQEKIYDFGLNLGLAFQIQDDYLDSFGDQSKFGKRIGGDILNNKKTYLSVATLEQTQTATELVQYFGEGSLEEEEKISKVKSLYQKAGVVSLAKEKMNEYTDKAFSSLAEIGLPDERKQPLIQIAKQLLNREN